MNFRHYRRYMENVDYRKVSGEKKMSQVQPIVIHLHVAYRQG